MIRRNWKSLWDSKVRDLEGEIVGNGFKIWSSESEAGR